MKRLKTIVMTCGLLTSSIVYPLQAGEWDKETRLTIASELQVGDTLLAPGQYTLRVAESSSARNVVQIFTGDGERIKATIIAIPTYRLEPAGTSEFTVSAAAAGQPATLRSWFYPGDNFGLAFPEPKQSEGQMPQQAGKSQGAGQAGDAGGR
jgi:hypothetical protein